MPTDLDSTQEFDKYFADIVQPKPNYVVSLTGNRPQLVFRQTNGWDDYKACRDAASQQLKAAIDGVLPPAWKDYAVDPMSVGRATHLARRHVGIIVDGQLVEEKWGELHFLKMAKHDPHAFQALVDSLNEHIAVGWTVEDRDYFPGAVERNQGERSVPAGASGGAADVEPTPAPTQG